MPRLAQSKSYLEEIGDLSIWADNPQCKQKFHPHFREKTEYSKISFNKEKIELQSCNNITFVGKGVTRLKNF